MISIENGFVALASYSNRVVAGAVFFHFGSKAIYKYGASDRNYQHLRANNLGWRWVFGMLRGLGVGVKDRR